METQPIALGAIIAAGITGLISLLGLIISKEQKTSDFRQQWIDSLRDEMSSFIGHIEVVVQYVRESTIDAESNSDAPSTPELFEKIKNEVLEAEKHYCKILLRINPIEHQALIESIETMRQQFSSGNIPSLDRLHEIEMELIEKTQSILKSEWVRVKKGELTFRIAKYSALVILVMSLVLSGVTVFLGNDVALKTDNVTKHKTKDSNK